MEGWRELNRANWDERVVVYVTRRAYDLALLRAIQSRLDVTVDARRGSLALVSRGAENFSTAVEASPFAHAIKTS